MMRIIDLTMYHHPSQMIYHKHWLPQSLLRITSHESHHSFQLPHPMLHHSTFFQLSITSIVLSKIPSFHYLLQQFPSLSFGSQIIQGTQTNFSFNCCPIDDNCCSPTSSACGPISFNSRSIRHNSRSSKQSACGPPSVSSVDIHFFLLIAGHLWQLPFTDLVRLRTSLPLRIFRVNIISNLSSVINPCSPTPSACGPIQSTDVKQI